MAYEYLNRCTDKMFAEVQMFGTGSTALQVATIYYETVLSQPKFKAQRFYFQRKLADYNIAYTYGYLGKRSKAGIDISVLDRMQSFITKHKTSHV